MDFDMKGIITFSCFFLLCGLFTGDDHCLFAQDASVKDIVAGYKANAALFQGSRICYKQHVERNRAVPMDKVYDYWSDGQNLLLRGGDVENTEKILAGQFPNNITSSDLEAIYEKIPIISYDAAENLGYRWLVYTNNNSSQEYHKKNESMITRNAVPIENSEDFHCPPFLPLTFGKVGSGFPTDDFFSCAESDLFLLGTQVIDGKEYYVLESRVMSPEGYYQFQDKDKGMNFCRIYRAWIDIKRGCIPVRIEHLSALSKNGQLIDYTPSLLFSKSYTSVFEVQEIQKNGTGFYPIKASLRFEGMAMKKRNQNTNNIAKTNNLFDNVDFVLMVDSEIKWEISKVIPDVIVDRESLVLPFPKGTLLFDDRSENIRVAGMTQKEYETMLLEQSRSFGVVPDSGMNGVLPDPNSKKKYYIPHAPQDWRSAFFIIGVNLIVLSFIIRYIIRTWKKK